jgi:hypothetical protein
MSAAVIEAVEALAERDKQDGNLYFTDRDRSPYENLENDTNQPMDGDTGVDNEDPDGTAEEKIDADESNEAPHTHMEHPGDLWAPDTIPEEITGVVGTTTNDVHLT